ncbi:putative low-complexity protein [Leptolyngbya sp. PCC 7375]|nr:putative low-complexity protein [Leptolyngbya sp. PCC 7375]
MSGNQYTDILKKGGKYWNNWRLENPEKKLVVGNINFRGQDLNGLDLQGANLNGIDFGGANLREINLRQANLFQANFREASFEDVDFSSSDLTNAYLNDLDLRNTKFMSAKLDGADFQKSNLQSVNLERVLSRGTNFYKANLEKSNLNQAALHQAILSLAKLNSANLIQSGLIRSDLSNSDLSEADLTEAELCGAWLRNTKFCKANLTRAKLLNSQISEADFAEAILVDCQVYGISAWKIKNLDTATQKNLIITSNDEPIITVDDLEIAQFIHILLTNQKIRRVIDTIASKVVLILGRFTSERKAVLDALREALSSRNYSAVVFDFEKPSERDLTETVSTLAHLSRFVIADITDAKSIPQELQRIIPSLPSVPIQPIILDSQFEYAMFRDFGAFLSVLPPHRYQCVEQLLVSLEENVIAPALKQAQTIAERRREFEAYLK